MIKKKNLKRKVTSNEPEKVKTLPAAVRQSDEPVSKKVCMLTLFGHNIVVFFKHPL